MCIEPSDYCSLCWGGTDEKAGEKYYNDLGWSNCHWTCWDDLQLRFESFLQEYHVELNNITDRDKGFLIFMSD